jgi:glycosyltransferase involved in cell wall biosynthesis
MNPIKVIHITNIDKENYYLNNLCDHTSGEVVEYIFVTFAPRTEFAESLERRGKQVHCLDAVGRQSYPGAAAAIWKILKAEDPDIVHTHLFEPSLIGLTLAKWQGRKTVLTRHHSDAVHEIASPLKRKFYLSLDSYISRKADRIIAPSRMVRDFLVEKESVPDEKVSIIPYGQTTERFDAVTAEKVEAVKTELGMTKNLALVNVSRLFHRKGHRYLFEAFGELRKEGLDATLYLVGDGNYRTELEKMTSKFGIADRVRFLGWRDDALTIMAAADIIVHPSLEDALSSAVIEAIMLEKPIIASDISGVRDTLDDGKYGEIVEAASVEAISSGLTKVIDDLDAARLEAKEGKQFLLGYMNAEGVAQRYVDVYRDLSTISPN